MKVTLICGLPNSGKTTFSKHFKNVFHLDDFENPIFKRKFDDCNKAALKSATDVYIEGCYHRKTLIKEFIEIFKKWKKVCIWINTPLEICLNRCNKGRDELTVRLTNEHFEPPTQDEGWDELIILNDNDKI